MEGVGGTVGEASGARMTAVRVFFLGGIVGGWGEGLRAGVGWWWCVMVGMGMGGRDGSLGVSRVG